MKGAWSNKRSYKRASPFYSAGILPYQICDDSIYFLLGKDNDGTWSDFGGRAEIRDRDDPITTATREFYEETIGSVMDIQPLKNRINQNKGHLLMSKTMNGSPYHMYVIQIPYKDYRTKFQSTRNFLNYINSERKYREKMDIRWVSLETMLAALEDTNREDGSAFPLRKVFRNTVMKHKISFERREFLK